MTWAVREKGYSQRRACGLVALHPKTYRYASKRTGDEGLRAKLRELASQRRRFGYRRLGLMLKRQGIKLSPKKLYRLYKEERLTVRKRGGRKRAMGTRAPMLVPVLPNQRWSLDFVSDQLTDGPASEAAASGVDVPRRSGPRQPHARRSPSGGSARTALRNGHDLTRKREGGGVPRSAPGIRRSVGLVETGTHNRRSSR